MSPLNLSKIKKNSNGTAYIQAKNDMSKFVALASSGWLKNLRSY